eukprot:Colp12_sorted_trinity150504_noHs@3773
MAKSHGVQQFQIVTSVGSNPNSWFLYPKTKGEAEEAVKALKFTYTDIYRPGLLDRGEHARTIEKIGKFFMSGIPVSTVAQAMTKRALTAMRQSGTSAEPSVTVLSNKDIFAAAGEK